MSYTKYRRVTWTEMTQGASVRCVGVLLATHKGGDITLLALRREDRIYAYPIEHRYTQHEAWSNGLRGWEEGDMP